MRLGPIQVISFSTHTVPGGQGYAVVVPQLSFIYPAEGPMPSERQMAAFAAGLQQAIDTAVASFEMHWLKDTRGTKQ